MRFNPFQRKKNSSFNAAMTPYPSNYPTPVRAFLTVIYPGTGSKFFPVEEISAEEIKLPDGSTLFTGVPPDISQHNLTRQRFFRGIKWVTIRMHYTLFGLPFTFEPRKWHIFSDEKSKTKLLDWGHKYLEVGSKRIVLILNPERTHAVEEDTRKLVLVEEVEKYVKDNLEAIEKLDRIELPYVTEFDVTEIEMMRTESFQIHDSKAFEKLVKSMENLGEEKSFMWIFFMSMVSFIVVVLLFLYFADQGVFDKKDAVPGAALIPFLRWF